jgi:hypothetical protein
MDEQFNATKEAYGIRRGKMWVSEINRDTLIFAGCDHLHLNVKEARAFRDWLNSVLPENGEQRR